MEGKRGKFKLDFRPWHGGRQGRNFEEFDFRSCHCGRQEWNYKSTVDFRLWHCGRQGRGKFIKSQILDSSFKNKSWILDHGIVEGKRREV